MTLLQLVMADIKMKRGQIWVETVIYTLIGLSLIGLVLAIVTPKINESRDKAVIEQTIASLNIFDAKVNEILSAPGNVRTIELKLKRGELFVDSIGDRIVFELNDSRSLYSEPGVPISIGRINVITFEGRRRHNVVLFLNYVHNITFNGEDIKTQKFTGVSIPYKFVVENKGFQLNGSGSARFWIDIRLGSQG